MRTCAGIMSFVPRTKYPRRLVAALFVFTIVTARAQERIMLHGTVNSTPVSFLYDTGSTDSLLFRSSEERLGLKAAPGPGSNSPDFTEDCTVAFDGISKKMRLAVKDRPMVGYFKEPIDGVLSWLDLGQAFQIDYEKNSIGVIDPPADLKGWRKWALAADARVLLFDCPDGRENARVGVDTGYPDGVILGAANWEKWRAARAGEPATNVALVTSAGAVVVNDVLRVKRISIGGLVLEDVPVTKAPPSIDALFGHCDAILGIDALKRLKMIIDRKNGALYTAPIQIAAHFEYNRLGPCSCRARRGRAWWRGWRTAAPRTRPACATRMSS